MLIVEIAIGMVIPVTNMMSIKNSLTYSTAEIMEHVSTGLIVGFVIQRKRQNAMVSMMYVAQWHLWMDSMMMCISVFLIGRQMKLFTKSAFTTVVHLRIVAAVILNWFVQRMRVILECTAQSLLETLMSSHLNRF